MKWFYAANLMCFSNVYDLMCMNINIFVTKHIILVSITDILKNSILRLD